jgi:uncharacterized integral membrane protein
LHYIDRVFATKTRLDDSVDRFTRLYIIVSLILLALTTGIATSETDVTIAGIGLSLPLSVIMGAASIVVALLSTAMMLQDRRSVRLTRELQRLYRDLDLEVPSQIDERWSASPIYSVTDLTEATPTPKWGKFYALLLRYVLFVPVFILPLAAQSWVLKTLIDDFGWRWTVLVPLVPSLCLWMITALAWIKYS